MDKFNRQIKNRIKPELGKIGFSNYKENGTMKFEDDFIVDNIMFGGDHSLIFEHYRAAITSYSREIKTISLYLNDIGEKVDYKFIAYTTIILKLRDENNNKISWFEEKGIGKDYKNIAENFKIKIIENYENVLFPMVEKQSNIHILDAQYNTPFDKKSGSHHWFHKLITAKLAGNTQYYDIYEYVMTFFRNIEKNAATKEKAMRFGKWVEMIEEIHNRLKDVQSLENPYLGSLDLRNKILQNQQS